MSLNYKVSVLERTLTPAGDRRGCRRAGLDTSYARLLTNSMKGGFFEDKGG